MSAPPSCPPPDHSPAMQYLDGLMLAIPFRPNPERAIPCDPPPRPTGDVVADADAVRKWSVEVLQRSQAEFEAAKRNFDAIRPQLTENLQALPPQVRKLMEGLIELETQVVKQSLQANTPPDPFFAARTSAPPKHQATTAPKQRTWV